MAVRRRLWAAGIVVLGLTATVLPAQPSPPWSALYVRVQDSAGKPVTGLGDQDFQVFEDKLSIPSVQCKELDRTRLPADDDDAAVHWVVYVDEELSTRDAFRARRAIYAWIDRLDLGRDSAAVYFNGALSGFTQDRAQLRRMAFFYGENSDRYAYGRAKRLEPSWKNLWPAGAPAPSGPSGVSVQALAQRGNQGELSDVLSALKGLTGWKALLYFGQDIPYRDQRLEYHDPRFGGRILADAGFTVFAFSPSGGRDSGSRRLALWAEVTGGRAAPFGDDPRGPVAAVVEQMAHGYLLRYRREAGSTCRWLPTEIKAACTDCAVLHGSGRFATLDGPLSLTERTLMTAALAPERFAGFPVDLRATVQEGASFGQGPAQPSTVEFTLRFPFAAAIDQDTRTQAPRGGKFQQRALFFVGVYDRNSRLMGSFQAPALLSREPEELATAPQEWARLDEAIELDLPGQPAFLAAIVVTGQNRRIAARIAPLQ